MTIDKIYVRYKFVEKREEGWPHHNASHYVPKNLKENRESSTLISRKFLLHLFLNFMKLILRKKNHIKYWKYYPSIWIGFFQWNQLHEILVSYDWIYLFGHSAEQVVTSRPQQPRTWTASAICSSSTSVVNVLEVNGLKQTSVV